MGLTLTAMRKNRQWIKRVAEKNTRAIDSDTFDDWTAEDSFVVDETPAQPLKKVFTYRKSDPKL